MTLQDFQLTHFALLNLEYEYLDDGWKITATTDVPSHLYCRMTTTPPHKHVLPSGRRGLRLTGDVRFCFVVYEDNEQEEAGDTLTHTWLKHPWPVCETRWFYFVGTINAANVVSETAIFTFHFPAPPPPPPPLVATPLYPSNDSLLYQLSISPLTPPTHWDKVRYQNDGKWVWWQYGVRRYDTYQLTDPPLWAFKHLISKITVKLRLYRKNFSAQHQISFISHSTTWRSPWYQHAPFTWGWLEYNYTQNPVTSAPWTYNEMQELVSGIGLYDTGIPSGIFCDTLEIWVTWSPPP